MSPQASAIDPPSTKGSSTQGHLYPAPRQLRFISNDGQPHAKRRRINAACLTCRRRKTRCSGERPVCQTCRQNGHACLGFDDPTQKPRPPLGDDKPSEFGIGPIDSISGLGSSRSHVKPSEDLMERLSHQSEDRKTSISVSDHSKQKLDASHPETDQGPPKKDLSSGIGDTGPQSPRLAKKSDTKTGNRTRSPPSEGYRVPFFRYFGPTAIVPGFKQMVVQVGDHRHNTDARTPPAARSPRSVGGRRPEIASSASGSAVTLPMKSDDYKIDTDVPFYDPEILTPNHVLITHLVETFFVHFGCSFPFLQRERFLRDVDEKRVDTILVDAVCAIAARFSNHPLLTSPTRSRAEELGTRGTVSRPDHGLYFAQRAKSAVTKTFSCPSMPIVQACILLAYEEFGSNHDSGLWMYLGIAIRMAQDLGMEKLEGIRFGGQDGPTPKTVKYNNNGEESRDVQVQHNPSPPTSEPDSTAIEDQKMTERERVDTFWAVFFMDRVVCSGTGRPVTLRDKDVELSFPSQDESDPQTGWPMPFPALIRIIHLYGRVTDLLNSIKEINHVTPDTLKRLTGMEKALTGIYQRLSPRLHFSVANFQHYVHVQQGTIFILLHFWFHALIVVLHQPTLLHSFDERIQQSFSDNRELSVSSAKTIADILAFAELLDAKSIVGSPFTSQPIYIAACAFLAEKAVHAASQPIPHRTASSAALMPGGPHTSSTDVRQSAQNVTSHVEGLDAKTAKYTLLATAAHQNYQRCHKALESLENYWAGTKYIITVLDQKAKGVGNPLLYTTEEMETAIDVSRSAAPYTTPPWKRKSGNQAQASSAGEIRSPREANLPKARSDQEGQMHLETPPMDPSLAIGWSLTGTTNSPNSSLTFLYQTSNGDNGHVSALSRPPSLSLDSVQRLDHLPSDFVSTTAETAHPKRQISLFPQTKTEYSIPLSSPDVLLPTTGQLGDSPSSHPPHQQQQPPIPLPSMGPIGRTTPHPTAEMLIDLHLPFSAPPPAMPAPAIGAFPSASPPYPVPSSGPQVAQYDPLSAAAFEPYPTPLSHASAFTPAATSINDMMTIQSQDVDVSALSGDMMPWLEYLPQDYLTLFDHGGGGHPPG